MLFSIGLVVLASFIEKAASDILSACGSVSTSSSSTSTSAGGLPTSCPPIKTCAWGYGYMHTIYEEYPNFSKERDYTKNTFEVSQTVDDEVEHDADGNQIPSELIPYLRNPKRNFRVTMGKVTNGKAKKGSRSRIYTVANIGGWGGFGDRTCSLNFRIPCNSTISVPLGIMSCAASLPWLDARFSAHLALVTNLGPGRKYIQMCAATSQMIFSISLLCIVLMRA
jgi:hypothetical protein